MHFSCIRTILFLPIDIDLVFGTLLLVFLSFFQSVCLWHQRRASLLRPGTLFILWYLLLILLLFMSGSVMRRPIRTSRRTSANVAFIQNATWFYWIFLILTFPLLSTVEVRSHCVASRSLVPPWSYRSFTPICTDLIICTSFYHSRSRYAHYNYFGSYIRDATHIKGRVCWLPWLWAS